MASFKQSTCTSAEIKDIIRMSLGEDILEYLDRYNDFSREDVPTEDEFLQKTFASRTFRSHSKHI